MLGGCSGKDMSNQTGLKHAPTEPAQLESKRSRRRAGGRAAALRRAPSDSDCSGETASLSADSAERAPRVPPPPSRQIKSRGSSRRRGSEWEVLEGLKDGQRFEKRPEVFNGYLHKKRKWPLKGWHKRFFVVDGGILVYARSPSDVARGRLHGSVDVGLSVISAKARRRRIDIDADEFIYHLRAKTPDVFRTWLNVLKAHRLYRQHLLTFGARESVPKIHPPLEDIPPTETSSHLSRNRTWNLSTSGGDQANSSASPWTSSLLSLMFPHKGVHANYPFKNHTQKRIHGNQFTPVKFKLVNKKNNSVLDKKLYKCGSLCSMHCLETSKGITNKYNPSHNMKIEAEGEMLMHSTNLDITGSTCVESQLCAHSLNSPTKLCRNDIKKLKLYNKPKRNNCATVGQNEPIIFCFTHKHRSCSTNTELPPMKRSKKSTNMVKYRNSFDEPPLKHPLNKCMLLGKYKLKISRPSDARPAKIIQNNVNIHETSNENELNISLGKLADSEFYRITDKLTETVYEKCNKANYNKSNYQLKNFISKIINELYCFQCTQDDEQPVKILFKCLLDYWINNKTFGVLGGNIKEGKCIDRPSLNYFTKNQYTSALCVQNYNEETQCPKTLDGIGNKKSKSLLNCKRELGAKVDKTESYNKERQIQELERLLKNTVYYCENISNVKNIEIRNQTSGTVRENLGTKLAYDLPTFEHGNLSAINRGQRNTNILYDGEHTPHTERNIYGTYVNSLKDETLDEKYNLLIKCSPVASKDETNDLCNTHINGLLSKCNNESRKRSLTWNNNQNEFIKSYSKRCNEKIETIIAKNDSVNETKRRNSFVVYLSKYNLNRAPNNANDPLLKGIVSIAINLNDGVEESEATKRGAIEYKPEECLGNRSDVSIRADSNSIFDECPFNPTANYNNNRYLDYNCSSINENISLKPFSSSSDATSKECITEMYESRLQTDKKIKNSALVIERGNKKTAASSDTSKVPPKALNSPKKRKDPHNVPPERTKSQDKDLKARKAPNDLPGIKDRTKTSSHRIHETLDESFVDSLLIILDSVSKCVPTLQKNISKLHHELLKKRDAFANIRVNSVWNKKPSSNIEKIIKDIGVQFDNNTDVKVYTGTNSTNVSVNTKSFPALLIKDICMKDKCLSTQYIHKNAESQTCKDTHKDVLTKNTKLNKVKPNQTIHRCFKSTKNDFNADKTLINYNRVSIPNTLKSKTPVKSMPDQERLSKNRKTDIKDISLHSSKTSKNNSIYLKDKFVKDHKVYRLFVSNKFLVKRSSSLIESKSTKYISSGDLKTLYRCASDLSFYSGLVSPTGAPLRGPQAGFVSGTPGGRLAGWIIDSGGPLENASRELGQAQLSVQQLQRLLDALEMQQQVHHDTDVSLEGASPNVKKDRRKFGLRKKKSNSKCASVELQPPHIDPSNSHMALSALTAPPSPGGGASSIPNSAASLPIACAATRPQSLPGAETLGGTTGGASLASLTPDHQLREDFTVLAKDLVTSLKGIVSTLVCERGRLRAAAEASENAGGASLAALRSNLSTALHQNSELRSRLSRIHDASDLAEISSMGHNSEQNRQFQQSLSYSSSCVSASEFFDAEEHEGDLKQAEIIGADEAGVIELDGDSSSEAGSLSSEEGSASSDNSEAAMVSAEPVALRLATNGSVGTRTQEIATGGWTRRTRLPNPRPTPGGPSLWNLLYKNIGKDLSQISMPVTINEPLNMLQRLCEELEYSELLDLAAGSGSGVERAALVAAFAVSAYAATAHRAASKPFNPLLAETYECVREDKGFRFIAEQVSHHPPISACHAESQHWTFWQEARIRTKFWGKSMEFQPAGRVHVHLKRTGDHYSWNKVTTCVHNLFGGQRWVDQYGDMHIACHGSDVACKLNFVKASSWSGGRHEVRGAVSWAGGRLRLAGRWSEALTAGEPPAARCLWRPGAMPPDHELYYGFTRFAMELNEVEPGMREALPHTDTRLRPDQRALEEGDVDKAEQLKHQLEQAQRERRREAAEHKPAWFRKSTESGEEMWVCTGEYWKAREAGFPDLSAPVLW